jgi:hypothetical protein
MSTVCDLGRRMFPIRKTFATPVSKASVSNPDRFRETTQRWEIEAGPLAGTALDYSFHDDWSVTWREVTGPRQGEKGRARQFHVEAVTAGVYLLSFSIAPGVVLTAIVDFSTRRLIGFRTGAGTWSVVRGVFRPL